MKFTSAFTSLVALAFACTSTQNVAADPGSVRKMRGQLTRETRDSKSSKQGSTRRGGRRSGSLFVMTNAEEENEIIMYDRDVRSGMLTQIGCFPTGGVGAALGGFEGELAPPDDPLASQDSLITVGDRCLIAVNAGSDTVTSFRIMDHGLWNMGQYPSGGDLPVSIAENRNIVYVLNAGGKGSVSGFRLRHSCELDPIDGSTVSLKQKNTEDPPFFVSSPAQVGFTPDGDFLVVSTKGVDGEPGPGTIDLFHVGHRGKLGARISNPTSGLTPFSFDFDDRGNLLIVEAFGTVEIGEADAGAVSSYEVGGDGFLSIISKSVPTFQTTTCWLREYDGCVLTTNNGGNSISSLTVKNGKLKLINKGDEPELNAPIDASFSPGGNYFYALSTGHTLEGPGQGQPGIYVYKVDRCGLKLIQTIEDGLPDEDETVFGVVGLALF